MLQELSQFDWSCEFFFDMPNFFSAPLEGLSNLSDAQKHCFFLFLFLCVFLYFLLDLLKDDTMVLFQTPLFTHHLVNILCY